MDDNENMCDNASLQAGSCSEIDDDTTVVIKCFKSDQGVTSYADYKSETEGIIAGRNKCSGVGAHRLSAAVLLLALFGYSFSQ